VTCHCHPDVHPGGHIAISERCSRRWKPLRRTGLGEGRSGASGSNRSHNDQRRQPLALGRRGAHQAGMGNEPSSTTPYPRQGKGDPVEDGPGCPQRRSSAASRGPRPPTPVRTQPPPKFADPPTRVTNPVMGMTDPATMPLEKPRQRRAEGRLRPHSAHQLHARVLPPPPSLRYRTSGFPLRRRQGREWEVKADVFHIIKGLQEMLHYIG
jgi:hypothetical protein